MAASCAFERDACQIAKEAELIQVDGKQGHGNKEDENFEWIDGGICQESRNNALWIDRTRDEQENCSQRGDDPVGAEREAPNVDFGIKEHRQYHSKAGCSADNDRKYHNMPHKAEKMVRTKRSSRAPTNSITPRGICQLC